MMIERILCAVDFSDTSEAALAYAANLAETLAGELVLLHAFDKPATTDARGVNRPADPTLRVKLETMQIPSRQVHLKHVLHAGPPGEVICWVAQDQTCDLIVMGTHGRTGLSHLLFGSTAEYVLRHARCPVLTIRKRPGDEAPLREPTVTPLPPPRYM
jgi:universal stress protein A